MASDESWRTAAYCPYHSRQERIVRVRSSLQMKDYTYNAMVTLICGEFLNIVTTARNLKLMEKSS